MTPGQKRHARLKRCAAYLPQFDRLCRLGSRMTAVRDNLRSFDRINRERAERKYREAESEYAATLAEIRRIQQEGRRP